MASAAIAACRHKSHQPDVSVQKKEMPQGLGDCHEELATTSDGK